VFGAVGAVPGELEDPAVDEGEQMMAAAGLGVLLVVALVFVLALLFGIRRRPRDD
jgi:hypothetical protein